LGAFLEAQHEIASGLARGSSLDQAAPAFLATICRLFGWDGATIWHDRHGRSSLESVARHGIARPGEDLAVQARESGQIAWDRGPTRSRVAVPIPAGSAKSVLAVAEFSGTAEIEPDEEVEEVLLAFAAQLDSFLRETGADPEIERVRQHMSEVVRGTQDAVLSKDLNGVVTTWNPAAERLYGYSSEEAVGRHISFLVPADHKDEEKEILARVKRGERLDTYETERIRADGARISVALTVSPIMSASHELIGASVIARDITAEKRERGAEAFLVAASRRLDASLDVDETARTIVGTAVPELAEICLIDFLRPDGYLGNSIVAAADPEVAAQLQEVREQTPIDPEGPHPVAQVLRSGLPMSWRDLGDPDVVETVVQSETHRRLMRDAGYHSAAVVPLVARGRTLGILSFLHASSDLRYDSDDLAFLSELGDRAAMALDNARLYQERDRIAQDLQRGLRPPAPPEIADLAVSVVFEPAGEGTEIGGDFYDVLPAEDGCWLLIGDVSGKGSAAAGVAVAVRHAVRGLCREIAEPEEVLARVNELLHEGKTLSDFATAELIRLRRKGDGAWEMKVAAAGHPPAVHVSGGESRLLGGGTILGAWPEPLLALHEVDLASGESLVLTTDGWFEVGPVARHLTPEVLGECAGRLHDAPLGELTERLRSDAVERSAGPLKDDMVVLGVRPR
jgi:PAS domain S-box-containing protein